MLSSIFSLFSQKLVLSGYVVDAISGENIIGANIFDSINQTITTTNNFGYFSVPFRKTGYHNLRFSYIGYDAKKISLSQLKDTIITVALNVSTNHLNEVIVLADRKLEEKPEIGKINIPISTIKTLPSITGEPDILKAYQLMPGIQMGAENNNGLYVRGGSPDQNLFLLDDVPLYNVNHLNGYFSVFDPSMLKCVDMYKGGFPARYGGRISSVVDVRNKDGDLYKSHGEIALGLISSKFFMEGPLKKGESSYAFSFRSCNFGFYTWLFNTLQGNNYTEGYYFYDVNFKINLKLSASDRLFLGFYKGEDNIYYNENETKVETVNLLYSGKSDLKWGNTAGSVRWLHTFNNGIFNNTTLSYTGYQYVNESKSTVEYLNDHSKTTETYEALSGTNDFQIKNDAEIPLDPVIIRLGALAGFHSYIPGQLSYSQTTSTVKSDSATAVPPVRLNAADVYMYTEFEYKITDNLTTNSGFRTGFYSVDNTIFPAFEPRIVCNYLFLPTYSLKASYSKMHQNIHLLSNSNGGLPTDIWIPSTQKIEPESSYQFSLGIAHTTKNNYEISVEFYSKFLNYLIDYKEGALLFNGSQNWEQKIETNGTGKVKGVEFLIRKKIGKLTGWVAYTLSSNSRRFENLNNGKEFPYTYDQTHNISIVGNWKITDNLTLSANWVYHTGNCITLPSEKYILYTVNDMSMQNMTFNTVEVYPEKNGYRFPDYHRLDISVNKSKALKKGTSNWSINVYNVYSRQNAYYLFYKKMKDGTSQLFQQSLFPILANISYSYRW